MASGRRVCRTLTTKLRPSDIQEVEQPLPVHLRREPLGDLDTAVPGLAQRPPRNHIVVISHKEFSPLCRPTTLKQLVSYVSYARIAKKVGGIWIMDARQRYLDDPSLSVKVRQEVPPTSS